MDTQEGFYYLMEASANMEYAMLSCESGTANLMITGMSAVQDYYEQQLEAMPQIYSTGNTHDHTYVISMVTSVTFADGNCEISYRNYSFDDPGFVDLSSTKDSGTTIQQDDEETQECAQAVNQYYENSENSYQSILQSQQTLVQQTSTNSQAFVQFEGAVIQVFSYAANLLAAAL